MKRIVMPYFTAPLLEQIGEGFGTANCSFADDTAARV